MKHMHLTASVSLPVAHRSLLVVVILVLFQDIFAAISCINYFFKNIITTCCLALWGVMNKVLDYIFVYILYLLYHNVWIQRMKIFQRN